MTGDYSVIYCDPPWHYNDRANGTRFGGGACRHYPLMKDDELRAMASFIKSLSADNCAHFMWATMPRLDFAVELLVSWGFRYTTAAFTWVKMTADNGRPVYGPGHYTASNAEVVLLGVKGKMKPTEAMLPSVLISPRAEHSRKPEKIREYIDRMYPNGQRIELFSRTHAPGWDSWGNHHGVDQIIKAENQHEYKREAHAQVRLEL